MVDNQRNYNIGDDDTFEGEGEATWKANRREGGFHEERYK